MTSLHRRRKPDYGLRLRSTIVQKNLAYFLDHSMDEDAESLRFVYVYFTHFLLSWLALEQIVCVSRL